MERGAAPAGWARNPTLGRLRASCRAALRPLREVLARREAFRPPGGLSGTTVRNGTAATANGREPRWRPKARPGAAAEITPPEMPRWSAERRAGRRHRPVIPGDPGIGPNRKAGHGCGVPRPAPVGALPPLDGGVLDNGAPPRRKEQGPAELWSRAERSG
jgi:hypothetical protein